LAPNGIRVNSVCPGFIETEAAAAFVSEHAEALQISMDAARAQVIKSIGGIPLGGAGDPTDVGDLVAFLASDHARYLTGAEFLIDGGSTAPSEPRRPGRSCWIISRGSSGGYWSRTADRSL
jgi:NAD(P)-dependent dehydrogenase (short-subunit alcohol dehydrogenase family)